MISPRLFRLAAVAGAFLPLLSLAGGLPASKPPKNDKLSKAIVLKDVFGMVSDATNVGATAELAEPFLTADQTIWYSYTPPSNGYLTISVDDQNDQGSSVDFAAYTQEGRYGLFNINANAQIGVVPGRRLTTVPVVGGVPVKLQFDSQVTGAFNFSYNFLTGAAFTVQQPTRGDGTFTWSESEGSIQVKIARVGNTLGSATVDYHLETASADTTTDLAANVDLFTGTVQFGAGETTKTLTFGIVGDASIEGTEFVDLVLEHPSANNVVPEPRTSLLIEDSDRPTNSDAFPGLNRSVPFTDSLANATATTQPGEPDGLTQTAWFSFTPPVDGLLTVIGDPLTDGQVVYISAFLGDTLATLVAVPPVNPARGPSIPLSSASSAIFAVHSGQTYRFAYSGVDTPTTGTIIIAATFAPASSFHFSQESYEAAEGTDLIVKVVREGDTGNLASVNIATSQTKSDPEDSEDPDPATFADPGTDYPTSSQTLTFNPGETSKEITLSIPKDKLKEGTEHFYVRLSSPSTNSKLDSPARVQVLLHDKAVVPTFYSGTFASVIKATSDPGVLGSSSITLSAKGTFTGSIIAGGVKYALKGALPLPPNNADAQRVEATFLFTQKDAPDLALALVYNGTADGFAYLSGTATVNGQTGEFTAYRDTYSLPLQLVGRFNTVLRPATGLPSTLASPSFLSIDVSAKGAVKVTGGLADGTKISGSGFLSLEGTLRDGTLVQRVNFVLPLYKGLGVLVGRYHLGFRGDRETVPASGDGEGEVLWSHPAMPKANFPLAFNGKYNSTVSRYEVPKGSLPFDVPAHSTIVLNASDLLGPVFSANTAYSAKGTVTFDKNTAGKPSLKIDPKTGIFSGKFTPTGGIKPVSYQGIILRNTSTGQGYFGAGSVTGTVTLGFM